MSFTTSTNMSLPIPNVGTEPGPQYATDVNNALFLVDAHDHSPGNGVPITPNGININTALTLNSNFLTDAAGVSLLSQGSAPIAGTIYRAGTDLYYVNGNSIPVQITNGPSVAGTSGSIGNLVAPASVNYNSSNFIFQSNVNIAANLDAGSILLRNLTPNSTYALTLSPPANLIADYGLVLPLPPSVTSFVVMDNSGIQTATIPVSGGITTANISPTAGILGTQLANDVVTKDQLFSGARQIRSAIFTSSGTWTTPSDSTTNTVYKVTCIGGGGSGAGIGGTSGGGGGGGAAGYTAVSYLTGIAPSLAITAIVGSGGTASAPGGLGNVGGDSSLFHSTTVYIKAKGGHGGGGLMTGLGGGVNNATGNIGDLVIVGGPGFNGQSIFSVTDVGGSGGSSTMGGGGLGGISAIGFAGQPGIVPGSGGGGSWSSVASGAGAPGMILIEWVI